jgi:hypothetical protein
MTRRLSLLWLLPIVSPGAFPATEDIAFVAEHLPEVAMDDRYTRLPLWDPSSERAATRFGAELGYARLTSRTLALDGPMLELSATRTWGAWQITAFGFRDALTFSSGTERRPLNQPFVDTPIAMPIDAEFSGLGGHMGGLGAGLAMRRQLDAPWLGALDWSAGVLWQRIRLSNYSVDYRVLEGPDLDATGTLDFSATYSFLTPFVGIGKEFFRGDFRFAPHVQYALPLPRRAMAGRITGPGFDLAGDTASFGAGKHFGDMSLTAGLDFTYLPWDLTIDAGSVLTQALFEPLVHEGIGKNWIIELRWSP